MHEVGKMGSVVKFSRMALAMALAGGMRFDLHIAG